MKFDQDIFIRFACYFLYQLPAGSITLNKRVNRHYPRCWCTTDVLDGGRYREQSDLGEPTVHGDNTGTAHFIAQLEVVQVLGVIIQVAQRYHYS